MSERTVKKGAGFYLTFAAEILAVVAVFLYGGTLFKEQLTYAVMAATIPVFIILMLLYLKTKKLPIMRLLMFINAVLIAAGFVQSFAPMANQLGFVVSGLEPFSTIFGFVLFAAVSLAAMLLYIISSYLKIGGEGTAAEENQECTCEKAVQK